MFMCVAREKGDVKRLYFDAGSIDAMQAAMFILELRRLRNVIESSAGGRRYYITFLFWC